MGLFDNLRDSPPETLAAMRSLSEESRPSDVEEARSRLARGSRRGNDLIVEGKQANHVEGYAVSWWRGWRPQAIPLLKVRQVPASHPPRILRKKPQTLSSSHKAV